MTILMQTGKGSGFVGMEIICSGTVDGIREREIAQKAFELGHVGVIGDEIVFMADNNCVRTTASKEKVEAIEKFLHELEIHGGTIPYNPCEDSKFKVILGNV